MKREIGVMHYKPRNEKDFWKPLDVIRGKEEFFLRVFGGNMAC